MMPESWDAKASEARGGAGHNPRGSNLDSQDPNQDNKGPAFWPEFNPL